MMMKNMMGCFLLPLVVFLSLHEKGNAETTLLSLGLSFNCWMRKSVAGCEVRWEWNVMIPIVCFNLRRQAALANVWGERKGFFRHHHLFFAHYWCQSMKIWNIWIIFASYTMLIVILHPRSRMFSLFSKRILVGRALLIIESSYQIEKLCEKASAAKMFI